MKKLVVIDACIRGEESRTRRIAEPVIETLSKRYEIIRYDLTKMPMEPLTPATYAERVAGNVPAWALEAARTVAEADRIVVVAPFWDMSFPAVVKVSSSIFPCLTSRLPTMGVPASGCATARR